MVPRPPSQAAWNRALIEDAVPALWSELLLELRGAPRLSVPGYYRLWPRFRSREEDYASAAQVMPGIVLTNGD